MIRLPPRSTQSRSSAASDVYKRQENDQCGHGAVDPGCGNRDKLRTHLVDVALHQSLGAADGSDREDAGEEDAQRSADAVDRPDVERVVDLEPLAQQDGAVAD